MNSYTAIIVEDSRLARNELKELLKAHPNIQLVAEAENVTEGYKKITQLKPDLVFLDINMPEKNGFELLEMLDEIPTVIFTTAYDEYAIKSFEYNAFDYLLKPINPERFAKTLNKLEPNTKEKNATETTEALTINSQIFIKDGEECFMVLLKDIQLFEIVGNYTRVYFQDKKPLIYKSLNQIELKLPADHFFRISRQHIINLTHVENITPYFKGTLQLKLKNKKEVSVSRRQSQVFKQRLEF